MKKIDVAMFPNGHIFAVFLNRYHAGNFPLFFSQYSKLKFLTVFQQKIEIFAFYGLLNIFVQCLLTVGARI